MNFAATVCPPLPLCHLPLPLSHGVSESATTIQTSAWLKALTFPAIRLLNWSKQRPLSWCSLALPPPGTVGHLLLPAEWQAAANALLQPQQRRQLEAKSNKLSKNAMQTERNRGGGSKGGAVGDCCCLAQRRLVAHTAYARRETRERGRRVGCSKRKHCNGEWMSLRTRCDMCTLWRPSDGRYCHKARASQGYGSAGGSKGGGVVVLVNGVWQLLRAMKRQNQIALQLIAHWAGRRGVHGSSTRAAGCTGQEKGKGGGMGARG